MAHLFEFKGAHTMIEFKVKSTTFKVSTPEKQALIEAYCAKIKRGTGRSTAPTKPIKSSNPVYPRFMEGTSTAFYVREYERANAYRFAGQGEPLSLFDNLSTNPQFTQDDSHVEEPLE
jgi:hypothetical protein